MMGPIIEELKAEYAGKLSVEAYNVRENSAPADQYKIRMIPTQVFLDSSGKEVYRHEGFFPKLEIIQLLDSLGVK